MIRRMVIFGASGDLTSRYLLPAVARLFEVEKLSEEIKILGVARDDWDTNAFLSHIRKKLEVHAASIPPRFRDSLISCLEYRRADVTKPSEVAKILSGIGESVIAYLALPPALFMPVVEALRTAGTPEGSRIVVEKPFGENLASARKLNRLLHKTFPEESVFRLDHFLGKQTVQNILGVRFANRLFEPLWNCQHIERVEIIWDETLALEGRAAYYDATGALRDMIQNHLLQLLSLVGMEAPPTMEEKDLRNHKVELLRAVRRRSPEEARRWTLRARYSAGRVGKQDIPAYADEEGVDPGRDTETFAQVTLWIDNWRWAGVPFILRSGKALGRDRREIAVYFKPVPHLAFERESECRPNVLRLEINPDRMALGVNINGPGDPFDLEYVELDQTLSEQNVPAYGRLLLDVLEGSPTLSIRDDEAEESWRIVEPILEAWRERRAPLLEYAAGSDGPAGSNHGAA